MKSILMTILAVATLSLEAQAANMALECSGSYFSTKTKTEISFAFKIRSPEELIALSHQIDLLPRNEREAARANLNNTLKFDAENYKVSYDSVLSCDNDGLNCRSLLTLVMSINLAEKTKKNEIVSYHSMERIFSSETGTSNDFSLSFSKYNLSLLCQLR